MGVTKMVEHTYGLGAYMRMRFPEGTEEEISVFWRDGGEEYRTTADHDPERRAAVIDAFNKLY